GAYPIPRSVLLCILNSTLLLFGDLGVSLSIGRIPHPFGRGNEQTTERSGGSVTREGEQSAKCTFQKDVLSGNGWHRSSTYLGGSPGGEIPCEWNCVRSMIVASRAIWWSCVSW